MLVNWSGRIPYILKCPKCEPYEDITEDNWSYINQGSPDAMEDFHICPECKKFWRFLQVHADELPNM